MEVRLGGEKGETLFESELPKSKPVILTIWDGDAHIQFEITQSQLRVNGDGGATRRSTWDLDLCLPRLNEK
jgi:hypothetical protein